MRKNFPAPFPFLAPCVIIVLFLTTGKDLAAPAAKGWMKTMKDQKFGPLPVLLLTLAGGIVGFFLRLRMLAVGYDAQGVQIPGSWPFVALWILSGVVVLGLVLICLGMGNRAGLEENFKAASAPGVCMMLSAAALFVCALVQLLDKPDLFTTLVSILGLGGASALAYSGYLRLSGKASGPAGMLVCLYLAALLICRFRGWSADPLLGDYCFELLAVVASMVAAYQLAGFPLGKGRRRASIFCSMAAVFFSCISLADSGWTNRLFFAAMILWQLTGCCSLAKPAPRRRKLGGCFEEAQETENGEDAT